MNDVAIGVSSSPDSAAVEDTLRCLHQSIPRATFREVFSVAPCGTAGVSESRVHSCLRQLKEKSPASVYVLMQAGSLPMPGWLDAFIAVFFRVALCSVVGPSTNRAVGPQGIFRHHANDPAANAIAARLRFGSAYRTLGRREYLDDFCIAVRNTVPTTKLAMRPVIANGPDSFSKRAIQESHLALWACGSYVHRPPVTEHHELNVRTAAQSRPIVLKPVEDSLPAEPHDVSPAVSHRVPNAPAAALAAQIEEDFLLASCIMPTYNRREFIPRAVRSFLTQDYPKRELIVVDDGMDPIHDLLPRDARVRYFRLNQRLNVGAKRNFACQQALGEIVLHWDDDEWYSPSRIRLQIDALRTSHARVSGTSIAFFYHENSERAFRYSFGGPGAAWMGALAYPLSVWKERPFDSVAIAEDVRFISRVAVSSRLDLRDPSLYIASIHSSNTSPKVTTGSYWRPEPIESLRLFPGFAPIAAFAQHEMPGSR